MIEKHPFTPFIPIGCNSLILGSFPTGKHKTDSSYTWYYESKKNQFWRILEGVYEVPLPSIREKKALFRDYKIGIMDIIEKCERIGQGSKDTDLHNIVYSRQLQFVLDSQAINTIFFTSRFVELVYKKRFYVLNESLSDLQLITLPSPSPRFARMSIFEKINFYRSVLPQKSLELLL